MSSLVKRNLSQYISDSIKLAKSMHIYLDTLKVQSRIMTYKFYGFIIDDTENKYILNMSGQLSQFDNPVNFKLNNEEYVLSRDLITTNEYVKETLIKMDSFYDSLVDNNRLMATYIKGCLASNTVEDTLSAKDGEILWYNDKLLENDRSIVISKAQKFIYDFLDIYHNKNYVVDELYSAGLVSNLYSVLPMVILVEKLNLALTSSADDFHIYNFFKSYKGLDNEVDVLDRKTLIWLYGNLRYMKKHIGKNEVLDMLLRHIMDSLGIGVGKMYLEKSLPIFSSNVTDIKNQYYTRELQVKQFGANESFNLNIGKTESVSKVLEREYQQGYIKDESLVEVEESLLNVKMKYSVPTKALTKVLPLDDIYLINLDDSNKFSYFLNTLIYQTEFNLNNYYINFLNPSDGLIYKLNSKQILGLFMYLMSKIFIGEDNPTINTLSYVNVLDLEKAKNFNVNDYNLNTEEIALVTEITKDLNNLPSEISTLDSYRAYFNISYRILHKFWYYLSNVNDIVYSTDLLFVINSLFKSGVSTYIQNISLKDYMLEVNSPILEVPDQSVVVTFKRLLETILGENIYTIDKIKEIINKILKIGYKFTSYTVQFLYSNDLTYVVTGHYQTLKPNLGNKSYISVNKAEFSYYDKVEKSIVNKSLPIKEIIHSKNIINLFRLYRPYKLEIMQLRNSDTLFKVDDIMFIKTGNNFPLLMKPILEDRSKPKANEIAISDANVIRTYTPYNPTIGVVKEDIGNYSYVINKSGNNLPGTFTPRTAVVNGFYNTKLNVNTVNTDKFLTETKLKIINYDSITPDMVKVTLKNHIPSNYKPEASGVDPADDIVKNDIEHKKIRNIEQPTVRVVSNDNMNSIPVIKIKR